jgi:hypothetical protein
MNNAENNGQLENKEGKATELVNRLNKSMSHSSVISTELGNIITTLRSEGQELSPEEIQKLRGMSNKFIK